MRSILIRLLIVLFIYQLVACNSTSPSPISVEDTPDLVADSLAIRATLEGWYEGMYKVDSTEILAPLTPQFLLLEDTLPLTGLELLARLKKGGGETKWSAEFSDLRTRFQGDVAWTTLKNHEIAEGKDGKQCQADFLETIVFVREDGCWLIDRYHAAVMHPWSCEE